jgi:hypothetical protein
LAVVLENKSTDVKDIKKTVITATKTKDLKDIDNVVLVQFVKANSERNEF